MPRLTVSSPKYRYHRASRQAFVELSGKRFYLGPHGTKTSKLEYDRLIGEWLANGRTLRPESPNPSALTLIELSVRYVEFARTYYRKDGQPTTEPRDIVLSLRPVRELYGRKPCTEFGPIALKVVRQRMIRDGLSRNVINQRIGRIVRMFKWAASEELLPANIHQQLDSVDGLRRERSEARETEPIEPVSDSIVDATLPLMPPIIADMVRLQRLTGMRPNEVCQVRPADIDMKQCPWQFRPRRHKTEHHGKTRVIFFGPTAQSILLRYLARDEAMNCFRPLDSVAKQLAERRSRRRTPLSCGNRKGTNPKRNPKRVAGAAYSVNSYRQAIYRACDAAFPHPALASIAERDLTAEQQQELALWRRNHRWAPNRLRHTAGTAIRKKFGIEATSTVLGHSNMKVTEIYAERNLALAAKVAEAVG